ncbi:FMNH2-dependent monooxygenase, partial [Paenibacillus sp. IB182496]|nr:FMNH2-dependent monooxygenase [Paenibacillus sabuli]
AARQRGRLQAELLRGGRPPGSCRLLVRLCPLAARTSAEAEALERALRTSPGEVHAAPPPLVLAGTGEAIAGELERWLAGGAADGFHLMGLGRGETLARFVELVVPELRRRGLLAAGEPAQTLRSGLGLDRPASRYAVVPIGREGGQ